MSSVEVRLLGVDELVDGAKHVEQQIEREAPRAFRQVASSVQSAVQARVPKLTGATAGSVRVAPLDDGVAVEMGEGVPWAVFVEYGGRGHPSSDTGNYLYPAATDAIPDLEQAAFAVAEHAIEGTSWPNPM